MPKKNAQDEAEEFETTEEVMPKEAAPEIEPHDGLVKVALGNETLHVHRNALEQHKKLGWKEV
jgi:hypothetical protein